MDLNLFTQYTQTKVCDLCGKVCKTPRGCLIGQIMNKINEERVLTGSVKKYGKVTFMAVQRKLSHLKDSDAEYTHSICKDSANRTGSYSKCFFGCLKAK